ncbi:MAG: hypothetical protein IJK56_10570 [Firmicutes bacterium]|nr:hypothetical protein [Bacillota bacterium]
MNGFTFTLPENGRLICIADCHGNYVLLRRLINRLDLQPQDTLAILGDFSNKGWGNLSCTAYLMYLEKARPRTFIFAGNGEYRNIRYFLEGDRDWILKYLKKWPTRNIYLEWAAECGFSTVTEDNFEEAHAAILDCFGDMMRWVRDLPLFAYNDRYLLVHSGLETLPEDGTADPSCIENDFLQNETNRTGRWEIVGHYPVANLYPGQMNPLVRADEHVIGIDGGVNTLRLEQLNALICTPDGFYYTFEDSDEAHVIAQDYAPQPLDRPPLIQKWPDVYVDVIRRDSSFSLCRSLQGREGYVKNECLVQDDKGLRMAKSTLAELLPVHAGEIVKLLDASSEDYWFVKNKAGLMGYVPKSAVGDPVKLDAPFAGILPLTSI